MITLTDAAADHLRELLESRNASPDEQGLRLFVEKGGCAGMNYAMKIDAPSESDLVAERDGVRVFVDPDSLAYLNGSQIDYEDSLNDAGFKVRNPNAARSCGCGTSFEPAAKDGGEPARDPEPLDGAACK